MPANMPNFERGRQPSAAALNVVVDWERHLRAQAGDGGFVMPQPVEGLNLWRVGVIVDEGPNAEADFSDERYWVRLERNNNGDEDAETLASSFTDDDAYPTSLVVTATNLSESLSHAHSLPTGETLRVLLKLEHDGAGRERWIIPSVAGETSVWMQTVGAYDVNYGYPWKLKVPSADKLTIVDSAPLISGWYLREVSANVTIPVGTIVRAWPNGSPFPNVTSWECRVDPTLAVAPTAKYQVLQCTYYAGPTDYTLAYDWVRAH
jgi:hypothetical protein